MPESHRKAVVDAMMGFGVKVREAWASRLGNIPGGERLTDRDWTLLEVLDERGEVPFGEAIKIVSKSPKEKSAVTAAIGRMSKARLLTTRRTKQDERKKTVSLTDKARKLIHQRRAIRPEMYEKIFKCWEPCWDSIEQEKQDCSILAKLFRHGIEHADDVFGAQS
ncbi:MAG: winged helix-turn-helix transcriptional regulator [Planctomycetes bacterium]|nr:winged helix-turn-helix transcriptional regulator [Planctomycetota bacterium]